MASPRELDALIRVSGEVDRSVRRAIENISDQMDTLEAAARAAQGSSANLSDTIKKQGKTLQAAQAKYASYVLNGQEASQEAQELANNIRELSSDLNRNRAALSAAEQAAQRLTQEMDEAGDSVDDLDEAARGSKGGFTIMKGVIADLISNGIQKLISTAIEGAKSLYGLAQETREFRQDMATLETAFDRAGFSADVATNTWKDLYAIFGEDDRAVEAANNISRMAKNQEQLQQWTRITAGIWSSYQDALPVEGLAEAAGETAKVGQVTGVFADALNWSSEAAKMFSKYMDEDVTTAEDAFNVALKKCSNEAERQALITETLTKLYGGAADKYAETAGSLMDANKATADYSLNMAKLGERIEPVTTAVQNGINKIITKLLEMTQNVNMESFINSISNAFDKFVNDTIPKLLEITGSVDMQGFIDGIAKAFDSFINDTIPKVIEGLKWIKDNKDVIIAGIIGIGTAFAAWKVVSLITMAIGAFTKFKNAIAAGKTVMQALNITMAANPIGIVIALVAGLVAAFIYLWNNCEWFRQFWIDLWNNIKEWLSSAAEFIGQKMTELGAWLSNIWNGIKEFTMAAVKAVVNFITSVWGGLIGIVSGIWNGIFNFLKSIWNGIKTFASNFATGVVNTISNAWSGLKSILSAPFEAVTKTIDNVKDKIGGLVDKFKGIGGKVASAVGLPAFAKGGFTNGVSIAGEAGTEAVISFDRRYRADNLRYWATAGRMLGADASDFTLSGATASTQHTTIGSVKFSPNITIKGNAQKQDIIEAIRETYPEFMDLIDEILNERNEGVYA